MKPDQWMAMDTLPLLTVQSESTTRSPGPLLAVCHCWEKSNYSSCLQEILNEVINATCLKSSEKRLSTIFSSCALINVINLNEHNISLQQSIALSLQLIWYLAVNEYYLYYDVGAGTIPAWGICSHLGWWWSRHQIVLSSRFILKAALRWREDDQ